MPTRALLLSAYIKFINLFPETKATIQEVLRCDSQIRNSDVELQQRAVEYLKLSSIASTDVLVSFDDLRSIPSHLRSSNETMKICFTRASGLHITHLVKHCPNMLTVQAQSCFAEYFDYSVY